MDGQVNLDVAMVQKVVEESPVLKMTTPPAVKKEVTLDQLKQALMILTEGIDRLDDKVDAVQLAVEQVAETIEELHSDLREEVFGRDFVGRDDV